MVRIFGLILMLFFAGCGREPGDGGGPLTLNLDVSASRSFGEPLLLKYDSCSKLAFDLKAAALDEMRTRLAIKLKEGPPPSYPLDSGTFDAMPGSMPAPTLAGAQAVEGRDYSGTNNQEKGIDEADIVKIDGTYFYLLNKSKLQIVGIGQQGDLTNTSTLQLDIPGSGILLMNDTAAVMAKDTYTKVVSTSRQGTRVTESTSHSNDNLRVDIVDLSADRKDPRLKETFYLQGELIAARRVGQNIYLASFIQSDVPGVDYWPYIYLNSQDEHEKKRQWEQAVAAAATKNEALIESFDFLSLLPGRLKKDGNKLVREDISDEDCSQTFGTQGSSSHGFLSLATITIDGDKSEMDIQRVRGNRPIAYASDQQFILASPEHDSWWFFNNEGLKDQTTIHRFRLNETSPPTYAESAQIPGTLHNSFSLSEYQGYLRAATTTAPQQRFWLQPSDEKLPVEENHLFVLNDAPGGFNIVSSVEGLAPGEKIWSARFSRDKAFLTTFRKVDPLFTIDLSEPTKPKVAGALKVPGVSTYLQDIGNDHLLAVGYGGDEEGLDFQTTVSLFDTQDFSKPRLASSISFAAVENLNNSWSTVSSEATKNHLAINYFAPAHMTAIPVNTDRYIENPLDSAGGSWEYVSKLALVNTKPNEEVSIHGFVDHSEFYNKQSSDERKPPQIRRSYFVGDYIYAISSKAITANRLSTMARTSVIELDE